MNSEDTNLSNLLGDRNLRMQRKQILTNVEMVVERQTSSDAEEKKKYYIKVTFSLVLMTTMKLLNRNYEHTTPIERSINLAFC